jgi:hypothetical protein
MTTVRAIESFEHNGQKYPGQRIQGLSPKHAEQLVKKGLAVYVGEEPQQEVNSDPFEGAGVVIPSSALPADQASQKTIAKPSVSGKKRGRKPKNSAPSSP